ncbi:uncharacterized protein [Physcomitrium patens]|uniref:DUF4378 domain-containing protein n=1 Tax=Physcomitrium patens TaxID=3218 RepID=A0A2K1L1E7_PHYPA|nr:uncharacterized protein LOC112292917 [Physcomitrium patens]PNR59831.1 hypothetical protein PHYPA_002623 [Physcomitrium patens]|eukprot:XP_024397675.1 uncharacterized protein LOC112292917 [Physcomitrella patens]
MADVRSPIHHFAQSPRIGGCTGALSQLFDWNLSKARCSSTKRLPAVRLDKSLEKSKSVRDDRNSDVRNDVHQCSSRVTESSHETNCGVSISPKIETFSKPKSPGSKHQRSRNFSGVESVLQTEKDNVPKKLPLRELSSSELNCVDRSLEDKAHVTPVEFKKQHEKRVRKGSSQTPVSTFVPYLGSPTGSCRSVYTLPYKQKGEKSPFVSRLHPSPVLQPSKDHTQNITPSSGARIGRRASRLLEAAVKILEEISDSEQCMRTVSELSPLSSGDDLLHCPSMRKMWNDIKALSSTHGVRNRSFISHELVSHRKLHKKDRVSRDNFDNYSLNSNQSTEMKALGILGTQEASVRSFKVSVGKHSAGARKDRGESMASTTNSVPHVHIIAADNWERKRLDATSKACPSGLKEKHPYISDVKSFTPQLSCKVKSETSTTLRNSQRTIGQVDDLELLVSPKRQVRGVIELKARSHLQSKSRSAASATQTTRKNGHGSQKDMKGSDPPVVVLGGERRTSSSNGDHGITNSEADVNLETEEIVSRNSPVLTKNFKGGINFAEKSTMGTMDYGGSDNPLHQDSILPNTLNDGGCKANLSGAHCSGFEFRFPEFAPGGPQSPRQTHCAVRDLLEVEDSGRHRGRQELGYSEELLLPGVEDFQWDDRMAHVVKNASFRAKYCETRTSGESLQSIYGTLDEDVCNVDDGSWPLTHDFAEERFGTNSDGETSTPITLKRFQGNPSGADVDTQETSPVSVLEWPNFQDECCTTSASSTTVSEQRVDESFQENAHAMDLSELLAELEREMDLLESRYKFGGVSECAKETHADFDEEKHFVREVLSAAQLLSSPSRSPTWCGGTLPVDPSLLRNLEGDVNTYQKDFSTGSHENCPIKSNGKWRCDRMLLLDCVNEALFQNVFRYEDPQPWLRSPVLRKRPVGQEMVEDVQGKIQGWRELAYHAIDTLIDIDMSSGVGKWTDFSEEVAEIGIEIESMLWKSMIAEVVLDLATITH